MRCKHWHDQRMIEQRVDPLPCHAFFRQMLEGIFQFGFALARRSLAVLGEIGEH